jgi:hypothetical protein
MAYSFVPNPATGMGLFVINGARTLYNSASLSFATALIFSMIGIGLFGFYMVSNTIQRDVDARVGSILAATEMHSWEYIVGKFLGNVAFLSIITAFYMVAMMCMYALRGEAPFEVFVFMRTYSLMCISAIVFVSVVALVFESIPVLAGRLGDVVYFFVWIIALTVPMIQMDYAIKARRMLEGAGEVGRTMTDIPLSAYYDVFGMGAGMASLNTQMPAANNGFSLGQTHFDPHLAPIVIAEVSIPAVWLGAKAVSILLTMSLLTIAYLAFHRFDPTKVRTTVRQSKRNIFAAVNAALKPLSKVNVLAWEALLRLVGGSRFLTAVAGEIFLTLGAKPLGIVCIVGFNVAALFMPLASLQQALLPLASVAFVILCSSIALRERRRGTTGLMFSLPVIKPHFIWLKLSAAFLLGVAMLTIPLVKILLDSPNTAVSLVVGTFFLSAAAVGLGAASGTAKVFVVCALVLFYLCLNAGAATPMFDFAGWHGTADASVQAGYGVIGLMFAGIGYAVHWWRFER